MDGVSWGANKLSKIGTQEGQVGTLTKWDWNDCGKSLFIVPGGGTRSIKEAVQSGGEGGTSAVSPYFSLGL